MLKGVKDYIINIINNHQCSLQTFGNPSAFGDIFIFKINNDFYQNNITNNFPTFRNNKERPLQNILIKMVYITDSNIMENMGDRTAVPDNDFIKEVKTQTEIYNLTNTFLQPITPSIFDSFIINKNDIFIDMLKNITLDNFRY